MAGSDHSEQPTTASAQSAGTAETLPAAAPRGRQHVGGEAPGDSIGPYKLLEVIGEGGFGVVWLAERREPMVQRVALKIIKPGMDSKAVIARFEQERQALAVMDHPNVARVFDGGVTPAGRPYFVLEHVAGEPITAFCDRHRYTLRQRLELFIPVCEAVQHAHQKGIIHRDIKPSNILVEIKDGQAIPKVIDFGVAKAISHALTDRTIFTEAGQLIGTPEYMSPEQAEMGRLDIDTRTDVYSLGVLLYEVLAGVLPFEPETLRAGGQATIQRVLRDQEAPRPSTKLSTAGEAAAGVIAERRQHGVGQLAAALRRELDWIPLKAMRKDRSRRYTSAEAMAADIRRYLDGRPLEAAPESRVYRVRKTLRRHAGAFVALSLVVASLVIGVAATLAQRNEARRNAAEAAAARDEAASKARLAEAAANSARYQEARTRTLYQLDQRMLPAALETAKQAYKLGGGRWEDSLLLDRVVRECQNSWRLESESALDGEPSSMCLLSHDGLSLLAVGTAGEVRFLQLSTGEWTRPIALPVSARHMTMLPGRGGALVIAGGPAMVFVDPTRRTVSEPTRFPSEVVAIATGTETVAVTLLDGTAWVVGRDGAVLGRRAWPEEAMRRESQHLLSVAVSPDDRFVLFGGRTFTSDRVLWDRASDRATVCRILGNSFVFAGDSTIFAVAHEVNTSDIATWWYRLNRPDSPESAPSLTPIERGQDIVLAETGTHREMVVGPTSAVMVGELGVGIVPVPRDGLWTGERPMLASSDRYGSLIGTEALFPSHVCVARDGSAIAVADRGRVLVFTRAAGRGWAWYTDRSCVTLIGDDEIGVEFNGVSPVVRATRPDRTAAADVLDLGLIRPVDPARVVYFSALCASRDGGTIAIRHAEHDNSRRYIAAPTSPSVTVARRGTGAPWNAAFEGALTIRLDSSVLGGGYDSGILLSPPGDRLLVFGGAGSGREAVLYDTSNGAALQRWTSGAFGRLVAACDEAAVFLECDDSTGVVRVREWGTGAVASAIDTRARVTSLSVPPVGRTFAISTAEGQIEEREIADGRVVRTFRSEFEPEAWSPDRSVFVGRRANVRLREAGEVVLANGRDGSLIAVLQRGLDAAPDAVFNTDGSAFLAPGMPDSSARYVLSRRMTPELADLTLRSSRGGVRVTSSPAKIDIREAVAPGPATLPDDASKTRAAAIGPALLGQVVTVEDIVASVEPTRSRLELNVLFGGDSSRFMLYIPAPAVARMKEKFGDDLLRALHGKHIRVNGVVVRYGGRAARYSEFFQIIVESPDQITIIDGPK